MSCERTEREEKKMKTQEEEKEEEETEETYPNETASTAARVEERFESGNILRSKVSHLALSEESKLTRNLERGMME